MNFDKAQHKANDYGGRLSCSTDHHFLRHTVIPLMLTLPELYSAYSRGYPQWGGDNSVSISVGEILITCNIYHT